MKKKKIMLRVGDKNYPCYETMGGNIAYEEETGQNMLKGVDFGAMTATLLCTFFWARCKGACKREGVEFPYNLETFVDTIEEEDLLAAINAMASPADGSEEADSAPKNA